MVGRVTSGGGKDDGKCEYEEKKSLRGPPFGQRRSSYGRVREVRVKKWEDQEEQETCDEKESQGCGENHDRIGGGREFCMRSCLFLVLLLDWKEGVITGLDFLCIFSKPPVKFCLVSLPELFSFFCVSGITFVRHLFHLCYKSRESIYYVGCRAAVIGPVGLDSTRSNSTTDIDL